MRFTLMSNVVKSMSSENCELVNGPVVRSRIFRSIAVHSSLNSFPQVGHVQSPSNRDEYAGSSHSGHMRFLMVFVSVRCVFPVGSVNISGPPSSIIASGTLDQGLLGSGLIFGIFTLSLLIPLKLLVEYLRAFDSAGYTLM